MEKLLKKDLDNLKYYIAEKERLLKEIEKCNDEFYYGYKSLAYDEVPTKTINKDSMIDMIIRNAKVLRVLEKREKSLEMIIIKLMNIIKKIGNPEIRTIVELRAVYGKTWEQIGEEIHMDASGTRKKYIAFINN